MTTVDRTISTAERGIILAADVDSLADLRELVEMSAAVPEVVAIKVGFSLALRVGLPQTVATIRAVSGLPVIYDHQKAATDIPAMGEPFTSVCEEAGVRGLIFFPEAGPKTLEGFVAAALRRSLVPIVGLVMTHAAYLQSEGGYIVDGAPESMCSLALKMGVREFVLPGTKTDLVARFANGLLDAVKPATIMMPGIGSQGGAISSAFRAAAGHRPYAIVGSAVYKASDAQGALRGFAAEVREIRDETRSH